MKKLMNDDCLIAMKSMEAESVHSLVTDPPAGISFMGKDWDHDKGGREQWIQWMTEVMTEAMRVMKPGAHGLIWAIPRTSHWTATALENAGFEIRDVVTHIFGSGFPKSLDISKAIDKAAGAEREVVGTKLGRPGMAKDGRNQSFDSSINSYGTGGVLSTDITAPATPEAKQWQGYGTALKPASEHWVLVRKPLSEKTVAKNVLLHGCGGLNIDQSRIACEDQNKLEKNWDRKAKAGFGNGLLKGGLIESGFEDYKKRGRFPANLVLSHNEDCDDTCTENCAVKALDEQSGNLHPSGNKKIGPAGKTENSMFGIGSIDGRASDYKDSGGASRFFYCAKASKRDRNEGLEGMPERSSSKLGAGIRSNVGNGIPGQTSSEDRKSANHHPTVKNTKLMQYLIKLITPQNGIVFDPFMGSGSTGVAAKRLGFDFVGIEQNKEYFDIASKRIGVAIEKTETD